jgi:two-component system response regulator
LVEDNSDDEILTLDALRSAGVDCRIDVVRDGQEAIDYLIRNPGETGPLPELVLLDLKLPKIGGHEVLRRIRANPTTRHLPVIVLTTSSEPEEIVRGYEGGANSYVQKPIEYEEFIAAVRTLGVYWLIYNKSPRRD